MKRSAVLTVCAALLLSACATSAPQSMIGPDGRPLPTLYKIDGKTAAAIPQRTQESLNALRAAKGLQPLQMNAALTAAAAAHSRDMSAQNRPWHFGSDGSSPLLRAQRAGYMGHFLGELISETYETELATLADWSSQADTRSIFFDPAANEMGFAWYQEPNGKIWWTLTTGDSTRPPVANVTITALGRETTTEMDGTPSQ